MAVWVKVSGGLCGALLLAGCAEFGAPAIAPTEDAVRPVARPDSAPPPPEDAVTVEAFDTTTEAERVAAAAAPDTGGERELGRTIASLGDPTDPGFWAKTPLVDEVQPGRLDYPETGKSVLVELRPLEAAPGSGSQVSLPALRLLEAPLTALPELIVFAVPASET